MTRPIKERLIVVSVSKCSHKNNKGDLRSASATMNTIRFTNYVRKGVPSKLALKLTSSNSILMGMEQHTHRDRKRLWLLPELEKETESVCALVALTRMRQKKMPLAFTRN